MANRPITRPVGSAASELRSLPVSPAMRRRLQNIAAGYGLSLREAVTELLQEVSVDADAILRRRLLGRLQAAERKAS